MNEKQVSVPHLLSLDEAATALRISIWTIRAWVAAKKIASVKLGARRLVLASEVNRIVAEGVEPATDSIRPVGRPRIAGKSI